MQVKRFSHLRIQPLLLPFLLAMATYSLAETGLAAGNTSLFTVTPADAAQSSTESFTVMITSQGFDSGTLDLSVVQGDTIKITFVLDASQVGDTNPSNHHVVGVSDYNVQTAEIDPSHPNATLTFVADKTGTFSIYCLSPDCPIHYLMLSGSVTVKAPSPQQTTTASATTSGTSTSAQTTQATTQSDTGGGSQTSSTSQGATTAHTSAAEQGSLNSPGLVNTGWAALVVAACLLAVFFVLYRRGALASS